MENMSSQMTKSGPSKHANAVKNDEEEKDYGDDMDALIKAQFEQIDSMNFEAFDFGSIDINESMHVGLDDYSIIMSKKKS